MFQKLVNLSITIIFFAVSISAQSYFKNWDKGTSPKEIGKRVAENWVAKSFEFESGKRQFVIYPEICTWYGALTTAKLTKDKDLQKRLIAKFDRFLTEKGRANINPIAHVDYSMVGSLPLEIFIQTKSKQYLDFGQAMADKQFSDTTPDGITKEARYWIDDMYMITILQVQAYRATKDKKYLDRAAFTADAYLKKLQKENGLFHHADDSFFYWSRGNGWFAAGMAELLSELPKNHPQRADIMKSFQKMMASLLKLQAPDGLWRQLLDVPESWEETSGTGMFAFAMVTGVKKGWLDSKTYGEPARKAWLALVKNLDENANIKEVCIGTNKGFSVQYYLDRGRETGNLHGQAPVLWTASALLR
ncbi:MAG TPA: glycoside hydrolase family 88 protein [Pyrinomonadaceae bacterium]|nr:glycoside hydrolase family 88 protein [Pyrinomonadaceae bacterium]